MRQMPGRETCELNPQWVAEEGQPELSPFDGGELVMLKGIPTWMGCSSDLEAMFLMGLPNLYEKRNSEGVITQHDTFELNRMASCHLLHSDIGGFA